MASNSIAAIVDSTQHLLMKPSGSGHPAGTDTTHVKKATSATSPPSAQPTATPQSSSSHEASGVNSPLSWETIQHIVSELQRDRALRDIVLKVVEDRGLVDEIREYLADIAELGEEGNMGEEGEEEEEEEAYGSRAWEAIAVADQEQKAREETFRLSESPKVKTNSVPFELPFTFSFDEFQGVVKLIQDFGMGPCYGIQVSRNGEPLLPSDDLPFKVFIERGRTSVYREVNPTKKSGTLWPWHPSISTIHFVKKDGSGGFSLLFNQVWGGGELTAESAALFLRADPNSGL
ncbi:hypothetical protein SISSUDRAFT_1064862 [Sistotremastrum suecicum HHB10207 ss-3]|uniref:Uncharacterized protein n=1 Tax=Sistotremastrum suecicum HHB10207 ss-3 TaxID=1314776 RepID=A0A166A5C2_9AGAM|nr:hypothetical protein SISSUDRAFT_1064862 [Sistotremastrum suecicum HHB10207 ss-3]